MSRWQLRSPRTLACFLKPHSALLRADKQNQASGAYGALVRRPPLSAAHGNQNRDSARSSENGAFFLPLTVLLLISKEVPIRSVRTAPIGR